MRTVKMLELKKERLERIIASIEDILKGDNKMDFVSKQLYQLEDASALMLDMAEKYVNNAEMQKRLDAVYGEGSTLFIGQALFAFYKPEK